MKHLDTKTLSALHDNALPEAAREAADAHLALCERCRAEFAALADQDELLPPLLEHDPGEDYFVGFAERVRTRIDSGVKPVAREPFDPLKWFDSPRRLAMAGAVAGVVVVAGVALIVARTTPPVETSKAKLGQRVNQVASPESSGALGAARFDTASGAPATGPLGDAEQLGEPAAANEGAASGTPVAGSAPETAYRAQESARAYEVRRNAQGEEIPVRPAGEMKFARPPAPAQPAPAPAPGGGVYAPKQRQAQPMGGAPTPQQKSALTRESDRTAQDSARPAGERSLASPTPSPTPAPPAAGRREGTAELDRAAGLVRLCGQVRDSRGRAVAGAQVTVADLGIGATSGPAGDFCLDAPAGMHTVSAMALGFKTARQLVEFVGQHATVTLALEPVEVVRPPAATQVNPPAPAATGTVVESRDLFRALPDTIRAVVAESQLLTADAARDPTGKRYDAAALAWERSLAQIGGGPGELQARFRLAEARYFAWRVAPTRRRGDAAVEALTAYLVRASAGEYRARVVRWLDQVRH